MPFGLIGNVVGNILGRKREEKANERNIQFWNMQNEYNSPKKQKERLLEAGLNPNLIYGTSPTSAVGNAGAIAPAKAAKYTDPLTSMMQFADTTQKKVQTSNLRTQNTVLLQEAALKGAQTAKTLEEGKKTKVEAELARELKQTSLDAAKENLRLMEEKTLGEDLNNQFKNDTIRNRVLEVHYRAQNAKETLRGEKLLNELRTLDKDLKKLGIERNDPWYFRILGRHLGKEVDKTIKDLKH